MNILFCQHITYPFIGVMSISAVLTENGHHTQIKIFNISRPRPRDIGEIESFNPDILAFPAYTGWEMPIVNFCREFKKRHNVITILGGPHPTFCPYILENDGIDYICVGEGEISFLHFVTALRNRQPTDSIAGIWHKQNGRVAANGISELPDINSLPSMDIDLYCKASPAIRKLTHREFSINRGCPFGCTYCNEPSLHRQYAGRNLRTKNPENAIREIRTVFDKYPFESCVFTSDNLFLDKDFLADFLGRFKAEINVPFGCQMRIELVTPEIAGLLKKANCHMVSVGVESGSSRIRAGILGRKMSDEQIIRGCRYLQEAGISINTNNMMGIPSETMSEAWETVFLNAKINPTTTYCSIFQPYPKSEITEKLISEGVLTPQMLSRIPPTFFKRSIFTQEKIYQFINMHRLFYVTVMHPEISSIVKHLIKLPPPFNRLYDIVFLFSFYAYVKTIYKKSFLSTFMTIFITALEALNVQKENRKNRGRLM